MLNNNINNTHLHFCGGSTTPLSQVVYRVCVCVCHCAIDWKFSWRQSSATMALLDIVVSYEEVRRPGRLLSDLISGSTKFAVFDLWDVRVGGSSGK